MAIFTSFMKPMIHDFIRYRKASQVWNDSYEENLKRFENHCQKKFPDANILTQEMVDSWCFQRNTENNKTYNSRIYPIIALLNYTNSRGLTNLKVAETAKAERRKYIPHVFTNEELTNFFRACDNVETKIKPNIFEKSRKLSIPIFFRLLYSTGMRPIEIRLLKRHNIDLENGIINIEETKGYHQHYVALHSSMIEILLKYDEEINKLYPNRIHFFPAHNDKIHTSKWVERNFREMWYKYNNTHAIPYDLRHHYAITNINNWMEQGVNFTTNLYYLSKSMGHSSIESTKYYYSLIPRMADVFENQIGKTFDNLIPEVNNHENN